MYWIDGKLDGKTVVFYRVRGCKADAKRALQHVKEKGLDFIDYTLTKLKPIIHPDFLKSA